MLLRADSFRARLLSLLGSGALAAATSTCSGNTEGTDTVATAGSAGDNSGASSGKGGSNQGGSGQGGSNQAGTGQGGVLQGGNGGAAGSILTGGFGGSIIQPYCPASYETCPTLEDLALCPTGVGGSSGSGSVDAGTECPAGHLIASCIAPGPLYPTGFASVTGPLPDRDSCCYTVQPPCYPVGRPFTVEGNARAAQALARRDWSLELAAPDSSLPASIADKVAAAWLKDALVEHASVASFARFTLELLALGAPPDLVAGAQYAALDEIRHARACFALAARYSGKAVGPSTLDVGNSLGAMDLASVAVRCVEEGCVGETLAAMIASEQAARATDPVVRRVLEGIAEDEARHAELAWRAVRWAVEQGGTEVSEAVSRAFDKALLQTGDQNFADDFDLRAHGRLSRKEAAQVAASALREVVAPCARALLETDLAA